MRNLRAVVVDDDEDSRSLLALAGRAGGFEVIEAGWALEASGVLERDRERDGAIDIVVSDIAMPGIDGIAFARKLHDRMPSLPIILVSAYVHGGVLHAASRAGVRTVLAKPFDPFLLGTLMAAHCSASKLSASNEA
jgi:two-component system cell cycle sensor histidine kinase/response regulator CckA